MVLATAWVALTGWVGSWTGWVMSASCGKGGTLHMRGARPGASCDNTMLAAVGFWTLLLLALAVAIPLVAAAVAMKPWVSWLVTFSLVPLAAFGVVNWTGFWGILVYAAPMLVVALIVALVQQIATVRCGRLAP